MKRTIFYLALMLLSNFIPSTSLADEFILNKYDPNVIKTGEYSHFYTDPLTDTKISLPANKYSAMKVVFLDSFVANDCLFYKFNLENGEIFYLKEQCFSKEIEFNGLKYLIRPDQYSEIEKNVQDLKKIKIPNLNDVVVKTVTVTKDNIYEVTFSNGLQIQKEYLNDFLNLSKKITNPDDLKLLIHYMKKHQLSFTTGYDNRYLFSMDNSTSPLKIDIFISTNLEVAPVVDITYKGTKALIKKFTINQNKATYSSINTRFYTINSNKELTIYELLFTKQEVIEKYRFYLDKKITDYIKWLNDKKSAKIVFYGDLQDVSQKITRKNIVQLKDMININELLTKYFKRSLVSLEKDKDEEEDDD
ncbi:hypothetical protein [Gilliamella sp. Pas-s95]|uniref:hypothetical protein n=1 Tax=Gilliamella sp. Pas-s95 TaxID=2687317 RepID=UPI00132B4870|nr:hypothetical protein [Gilliamella sp. Pas-s95]MWN04817.1 hypothetical protein [Gilliamella sp. Pas-s95]